MSDTTPAARTITDRFHRILDEQSFDGPFTPDQRFGPDLGADSLDLVELIIETELEFGIEIPDRQVDAFVRVGDVIAYLETHVR